jgi:micrococcal nuclease
VGVLGALLLVLPSAQAAPAADVLHDVVRVVDGDTLWIEVEGRLEKLRLASVDTEERFSDRPTVSPTRPQTVFGEETALWTEELLRASAPKGRAPRVRLRFPPGGPRRDAFGRLLCHVLLEDGRDLNLLLVARGRSPYFVKYGSSRLEHEAFLEAERRARALGLGLWDPTTNRPRTTGGPAAIRPYALLLPWWRSRAAAIERFRSASPSDGTLAAGDVAGLARAAAAAGPTQVFGAVGRLFEEADGGLTAHLYGPDGGPPLRIALSSAQRAGELERKLRSTLGDLVQNYVYVRGRVLQGARGFRMVAGRADDWRVAQSAPDPEDPNRRAPETMSTEIELKFAVDGEEAFDALIRHLDLPAREFHRTTVQVNHFFDTPTFALRDRRIALRLREEGGRHVLTLKGKEERHSDDGVAIERVEVEVRLAPEIALDVLQGSISPRDAFARRLAGEGTEALRLLDEALDGAELHYVGRFENVRTRVAPVPLEAGGQRHEFVFELDRTALTPERTDFEIEVELPTTEGIEEVRNTIVALLDDAGVAWRPAESKAQRFFALVRRQAD